jgi:hypothetical protein
VKVERANRITAFGERLEKREKRAGKEGGMYGVFHRSYHSLYSCTGDKSMNPQSMTGRVRAKGLAFSLRGLECNTLS